MKPFIEIWFLIFELVDNTQTLSFFFPSCINNSSPINSVATLALGSRPRQRLARLWAKKEARESGCMLLGVQESVREQTLAISLWTFGSPPRLQLPMWEFPWECDPFGHLKHKLWPKERLGVKLAVWLPTTKSLESTQFTCVQVACYIPLKISWWRLQLCTRLHLNQRSACGVMGPQSWDSRDFGNFGTPTWESWDKMPFRCRPCGEAQNIL